MACGCQRNRRGGGGHRAVAPNGALGYIRELMRYATLLFLLASGLTAQQASIEGVTVNALTGEPLSGVDVRLITGTFGGITGAYGAVTSRRARWEFEDEEARTPPHARARQASSVSGTTQSPSGPPVRCITVRSLDRSMRFPQAGPQ